MAIQQTHQDREPLARRAQRFLTRVDYPAHRDYVIQCAREDGAHEEILAALRALPEQDFECPEAVSRQLGERG